MGIEIQTPAQAIEAKKAVAPVIANTSPDKEVLPSVETKTDDVMSPKFAALAKKEKWIREQQRAMAEEKKNTAAQIEAAKQEVNNDWKKRLFILKNEIIYWLNNINHKTIFIKYLFFNE